MGPVLYRVSCVQSSDPEFAWHCTSRVLSLLGDQICCILIRNDIQEWTITNFIHPIFVFYEVLFMQSPFKTSELFKMVKSYSH